MQFNAMKKLILFILIIIIALVLVSEYSAYKTTQTLEIERTKAEERLKLSKEKYEQIDSLSD